MFMETLSVVVPVHNGGENFRKCLEGLSKVSPKPDEIIVVADGCTDDSAHLAKKFGARVLVHSATKGPSVARNRGAREARGDILFFLDSDVVVPPETTGKILEIFEREESLAAVIGSYDDTPGDSKFLSQYKNLFHHFIHQNSMEEASTFWGACGAIRREVFFEVCGFDSRYRQPSVEDIELGLRLKKFGYRILLSKSLQVKHLKRWDAGTLVETDFLYRAVPWSKLILRNRELKPDLNTQVPSVLSVVSVQGLFLCSLGVIRFPLLILPAFLFLILLIGLNLPLYRFFRNKRGISFALKSVPWHWFYYFYCGLAFGFGVIHHLVEKISLIKSFPHLGRTTSS